MKDNNIFKARLNCGAIVIISRYWHLSKRTVLDDAIEAYNSFKHKDSIHIKDIGYDETTVKE
jgi:hypothetical protein